MKIASTGPVVLFNDMTHFVHVMYAYTPPELRGQGLMRKLWVEQVLPAQTRDLWLELLPDAGTDPARLRSFYESLGFEFHENGRQAVLVAPEAA